MPKNVIKNILKISITIGLITWFLHRCDIHKVIMVLSELPLTLILIIILVNILAILVASYKWNILLPQCSFISLLKSIMIGRFYSVILPGQIAGEAVKAYKFGKGRKEAEQIVASVFLDKFTGVISLLLIGLLGICLSNVSLKFDLLYCFIIFNILSIFGLFFFRFKFSSIYFACFIKWIKHIKCLRKILNRSIRFFKALKNYTYDNGILTKSILLGFLYQLIVIFMHIIIAWGLGINVPFVDWCWILSIVSVAIFLPVTIAGIGIREGAFIGMLSWFGINIEKALALSFLILAIQIMDALVGWMVELIDIKRKFETD
jgi:glycosyltransferase 2 family protein